MCLVCLFSQFLLFFYIWMASNIHSNKRLYTIEHMRFFCSFLLYFFHFHFDWINKTFVIWWANDAQDLILDSCSFPHHWPNSFQIEWILNSSKQTNRKKNFVNSDAHALFSPNQSKQQFLIPNKIAVAHPIPHCLLSDAWTSITLNFGSINSTNI